jgi:F0F1-type ATP synthase membrane subunit b/b'
MAETQFIDSTLKALQITSSEGIYIITASVAVFIIARSLDPLLFRPFLSLFEVRENFTVKAREKGATLNQEAADCQALLNSQLGTLKDDLKKERASSLLLTRSTCNEILLEGVSLAEEVWKQKREFYDAELQQLNRRFRGRQGELTDLVVKTIIGEDFNDKVSDDGINLTRSTLLALLSLTAANEAFASPSATTSFPYISLINVAIFFTGLIYLLAPALKKSIEKRAVNLKEDILTSRASLIAASEAYNKAMQRSRSFSREVEDFKLQFNNQSALLSDDLITKAKSRRDLLLQQAALNAENAHLAESKRLKRELVTQIIAEAKSKIERALDFNRPESKTLHHQIRERALERLFQS